MDFETALYNELNTVSGIGKVFPLDVIEGNKAPFCVYESSDGVQEKTLSGFVSSTEIDVTLYVVQTSYSSVKSVSRTVINKLQSFQSRVIGGTGGVFVYDITYDKPKEVYNNENLLYQAIIDFTVKI
jgi:hypothetical protein